MTPGELQSSNELAVERTNLAIERTVMAAGRTLMGWVRTSLTMISFGFTIYKFLQAALQSGHTNAIGIHGPRRLGLFLIALGVMSVLLGSLEYFWVVRRMNTLSTKKYSTVNMSLIVGIVIGLLGLFLFITIATNTEVL